MQTRTEHRTALPNRLKLPEDKATHALLSDISLGIIALGAGNFTDNFAIAAGETIGADMLFISRIKSKEAPVETYALYDRSGQTTHYSYPLKGTPCEIVYNEQRPYEVNEEVVACFPEDQDLSDLGLSAYAGVPLIDENKECIGLIAAMWKTPQDNLSLKTKALEYFAPLLTVNMVQLEAKARNELAVAGAASGAWYTDFEEDVEYFSQAARRIIGHPDMAEKASRNTALNTLEPGDRRTIAAAFEAYRRGDSPYDVNFRVYPPHGDPRWLRMTGKAKYNANGHMTAMAGDITDISELVDAKRAAEAASIAKSDFLATMSHEIRTPMNGVLSMAGILSKADIPEGNKRQAEVIRKSGEAMMVILNDVLDLSKIEAGKLELEERAFSPRELIEDVTMLWQDTIEQKGISFSIEIKDPVPEIVIGDETRLRQVLTNLISNALKFTQEGSITMVLEATSTTSSPALKFSVSDTGIGITKAQQLRLFEAFNQANSSIARRFGGTGLGLAISDKIVRLMGGKFKITSKPGRGSTFSFTVTVLPAEQTAPAKTPSSLPKTDNTPTPAQPKRTILIAEDNEINQSVLKAFLSRLPVTLTFVDNGAKAVEHAQAQAFDVILMDVQMPILDGVGATKKIRAGDGPCRQTPIIALTANAMPGDRQRYLDLGMTGYVSKPIDPAALYEAIKAAKPQAESDKKLKGNARSARGQH